MGVQCCPDLNLFLILCHTGLEYDEGELITGFSLLGELSIEVFYTLPVTNRLRMLWRTELHMQIRERKNE